MGREVGIVLSYKSWIYVFESFALIHLQVVSLFELCRAILHSKSTGRFHFAYANSDLLVLASRPLYGKENTWLNEDAAGKNAIA